MELFRLRWQAFDKRSMIIDQKLNLKTMDCRLRTID